MRYNGAIFDLDGTLLDTLDDLADSMNQVLRHFGMPTHPVDPYRYFVGDGMLNLALRAAPAGTDVETAGKMAEMMNTFYSERWANKTRPYDGIPEMLEAMKRNGLKLGMLSNKPHSFTLIMAKHFFGDGFFDQAFGARTTVPRKPDPAGALEIAANLGLEPGAFLYFGDTNTDMRTGLAAGMRTIGVAWGFRPVEELRDAGAQAIIEKPAEALAFLA